MSTTLKGMLGEMNQNWGKWREDVVKAAAASEEDRLSALTFPGDERTTSDVTPTGYDTVNTPAAPGTVTNPNGPQGTVKRQIGEAASQIAPDGGTGVSHEERPLTDPNPVLDEQDLMKEGESVVNAANRIVKKLVTKQATNKGTKEYMKLTPETIQKLASMTVATRDGMQGSQQYTPEDLFNFGVACATRDIVTKMACAIVKEAGPAGLVKFAQDIGAPEDEVAKDVLAAEGMDDDGYTVEEVIETVQDMVDEGIIDEDTGAGIIEEVAGGVQSEGDIEDVTSEDILEAIDLCVEEGEITPEDGAALASEVIAELEGGAEGDDVSI